MAVLESKFSKSSLRGALSQQQGRPNGKLFITMCEAVIRRVPPPLLKVCVDHIPCVDLSHCAAFAGQSQLSGGPEGASSLLAGHSMPLMGFGTAGLIGEVLSLVIV